MQLDFSATHPGLQSNVVAASKTPGAAASKREREKRATYSDCAGKFVPLVIEHYGRWGVDALHFLKTLSRRASATLPGVTAGQFSDFWLKAVGCALVKGVTLAVVNNAVAWNRGNGRISDLQSAILGLT